MSVYRATYKGKGSKNKKTSTYTAEFWFEGIRHRKTFPKRADANHWILTEKLRLHRRETGYVNPSLAVEVKDLVSAYIKHLAARKLSDGHIYNTEKRLNRLCLDCLWNTVSDITLTSFEAWRESSPEWHGRKLSGKTLNQYLDSCREFSKWLVRNRKMATSPFREADRVVAPANAKYRRAAKVDELQRLFDTCPVDRCLQYEFRLYCPIRAKAVGALTWDDMHLEAEKPYGQVPAWFSKDRQSPKFYIRKDLAKKLLTLRGGADVHAKVFDRVLRARDLRKDLDRAGVPYSDSVGNRRFDFHSLRRTFIKMGKAAGIGLEVLHQALHHKDIATTRKYYDDDTIDPPLADATEALPSITPLRSPLRESKSSGESKDKN